MPLLRDFVYPKDVRLVAHKNEVCKFYLNFDGGFRTGISKAVQNDIEIVISNILLGIPENVCYITTKNIRVKIIKKIWNLENHRDITFQCQEKRPLSGKYSYYLYITFMQRRKHVREEQEHSYQERTGFNDQDDLDENIADEESGIAYIQKVDDEDVEIMTHIKPKVVLQRHTYAQTRHDKSETELKALHNSMNTDEVDMPCESTTSYCIIL